MRYYESELSKYEYFDDVNLDYSNDFLTGTIDRKNITKFIEYQIQHKKVFSIAIFDIDFFKTINDKYGHMIGDYVLKKVCEVVRSVIDDKGLIGRFGGDEFIIYFDDIEDYDELRTIIKKVHDEIRSFKFDGKLDERVSITSGVARFPFDSNTYSELFKKADKALYRGKQKGRNCFIIYKDELHKNIDVSTKSGIITVKDMIMQLISISNEDIPPKDMILKAFEYVSKNFSIDHICINGLNGKEEEFIRDTIDFKYDYYDNKMIEKHIENGYFKTFDYSNLRAKTPEFGEILYQNHVKAIMCFEIKFKGVLYGYLRVEDSSIKRNWQEEVIVVCIHMANMIGILKYYGEKNWLKINNLV